MSQKGLMGALWSLILITTTTMSRGEGGGNFDSWDNQEVFIDKIVSTDIFFQILDPPELEYTYMIRPAQDFGAPFNGSFSEEGIPLVSVEPPTGCGPITNGDQLKRRIALVERGDCSFFTKSLIAEDNGAKAVIIADYSPASIEESVNSPLWMDYYYIEMIRDNSVPSSKSVNIPVAFLLGKNGKMIRDTLKRLNKPYALINIPVNLTYTPLEKLHQPPWHLW